MIFIVFLWLCAVGKSLCVLGLVLRPFISDFVHDRAALEPKANASRLKRRSTGVMIKALRSSLLTSKWLPLFTFSMFVANLQWKGSLARCESKGQTYPSVFWSWQYDINVDTSQTQAVFFIDNHTHTHTRLLHSRENTYSIYSYECEFEPIIFSSPLPHTLLCEACPATVR